MCIVLLMNYEINIWQFIRHSSGFNIYLVIAQQESSYPLLKPDSETKQRILYPDFPQIRAMTNCLEQTSLCSLLCKKILFKTISYVL